ncbi:hypothetical protein B0T10DRAFT_475159 [Thelonectria olida]|uniref:C2H2-type domain-containing protein n=1 Tax=Thelonectria olida TaxID=1576542 RepID=A0A9P9AX06_9HYPO|nr:hypothetical protein B0T10DRAFT_475159 [Thelonectria olida]
MESPVGSQNASLRVPKHISRVLTQRRRLRATHARSKFECRCGAQFDRLDSLGRHLRRYRKNKRYWKLHYAVDCPTDTKEDTTTIGVSSVKTQQETEDWDETELRYFLRNILVKNLSVEDTVDEIVAFLAPPGVLEEHENGQSGPLIHEGDSDYKAGPHLEAGLDPNGFLTRWVSKTLLQSDTKRLPSPGRVPGDVDLLHGSRGSGYVAPPSSEVGDQDNEDQIQAQISEPRGLVVSFGSTDSSSFSYPLLASDTRPLLDRKIPGSFSSFNKAKVQQDGSKNTGPDEDANQDSLERAFEKSVPLKEATFENQSPSPSSTPNTLDSSTSDRSMTPETDVISAVLSSERAEKITNHLFAFFGKLIDEQLDFLKCQTSGAASGSGRRHGSEQQPTTDKDSGRSLNKGKRPLRRGDDENDSEMPGDGQGGRQPAKKRLKVDAPLKEKIACPFMKRYPQEFSTWRTCVGPGFDGIHRMKEHLRRRHFKERTCGRCGEQFDANSLLHEHMRAREPCEVRPIQISNGFVTQFQMDDISKVRHAPGATITQTWGEIYMVLFPDIDEGSIPGPFFETLSTSAGLSHLIDPQEYETYLKDHLPRRVLVKLNAEFQIMAEHAKQRLVDIVHEESLETLRGYMLQKGVNPLPSQDQPSAQLLDQPPAGDALLGLVDSVFPPGWDLDPNWQVGNTKEGEDSTYGSNMGGWVDDSGMPPEGGSWLP